MKKIYTLTMLSLSLSILLAGCESPEEMREIERRRAAMTPYKKCVASAKQSAGFCGLGCSGDLMSRYAEMVERGRQCSLRCSVQENVALNSCSYQR